MKTKDDEYKVGLQSLMKKIITHECTVCNRDIEWASIVDDINIPLHIMDIVKPLQTHGYYDNIMVAEAVEFGDDYDSSWYDGEGVYSYRIGKPSEGKFIEMKKVWAMYDRILNVGEFIIDITSIIHDEFDHNGDEY